MYGVHRRLDSREWDGLVGSGGWSIAAGAFALWFSGDLGVGSQYRAFHRAEPARLSRRQTRAGVGRQLAEQAQQAVDSDRRRRCGVGGPWWHRTGHHRIALAQAMLGASPVEGPKSARANRSTIKSALMSFL
jgi:hypothetical protein